MENQYLGHQPYQKNGLDDHHFNSKLNTENLPISIDEEDIKFHRTRGIQKEETNHSSSAPGPKRNDPGMEIDGSLGKIQELVSNVSITPNIKTKVNGERSQKMTKSTNAAGSNNDKGLRQRPDALKWSVIHKKEKTLANTAKAEQASHPAREEDLVDPESLTDRINKRGIKEEYLSEAQQTTNTPNKSNSTLTENCGNEQKNPHLKCNYGTNGTNNNQIELNNSNNYIKPAINGETYLDRGKPLLTKNNCPKEETTGYQQREKYFETILFINRMAKYDPPKAPHGTELDKTQAQASQRQTPLTDKLARETNSNRKIDSEALKRTLRARYESLEKRVSPNHNSLRDENHNGIKIGDKTKQSPNNSNTPTARRPDQRTNQTTELTTKAHLYNQCHSSTPADLTTGVSAARDEGASHGSTQEATNSDDALVIGNVENTIRVVNLDPINAHDQETTITTAKTKKAKIDIQNGPNGKN